MLTAGSRRVSGLRGFRPLKASGGCDHGLGHDIDGEERASGPGYLLSCQAAKPDPKQPSGDR